MRAKYRKRLFPLFCASTVFLVAGLTQFTHAADLVSQETAFQYIPKAVATSLEKSQIPQDAISISVREIGQAQEGKEVQYFSKTVLDWRSTEAMNPASTIKLVTTLAGLDVLGPQYRWRTKLFTDGAIHQGVLKGNLYLQGSGDPKLIPEELARMMKDLQGLGIQKIDGNLIFDRSAYAPSVMEQNTIDGEALRAYNVAPDPLLYAFRTLSFQMGKSRTADFIDINYTPTLSNFKISNEMRLVNRSCDSWKKDFRFEINSESSGASPNQSISATFSGVFPNGCRGVTYNVVALDANTFLSRGFIAAWELAGGTWAQTPTGSNGTVPITARPLMQFEGINLADDVQDINKFSNNVMARQLMLTLALEKMGLQFPELVIENGSGLSRNEAISAQHMNELLVTARKLAVAETFYNSLPLAGADGTMRNRLMTQLRTFLHLKKKPEARSKTGSLSDVRAISGYVISKSGKMYAVTSFINHPNAWRGLEAHDQLLAWLLEDGPEPKQAR